jgi:amino acid transporter
MATQDIRVGTDIGDNVAIPLASKADEALAKNSVSLIGALFVSIATMGPGIGAAYAVMAGAPFAGGALPLSVLVALIGSLCVAVAVGQLAKHMASAGGITSYIGRSIHPGLGFVTSWGYPLVYVLCQPYFALVFGSLVASAIVPSATGAEYTIIWVAGALFLIGTAFALNLRGAHVGAEVAVVLGSFEILFFLVLSVAMIVDHSGSNTASVLTAKHANAPGFHGLSGVIAGSIFGFLAFIGFEAAAPLAAETKNPKRNIPRAVVGSALLVGLFFLFTTYAVTIFFGPDHMVNFLSFNGGNGWIGLTKKLWGAGWIVLLIVVLNSSLACSESGELAATHNMWAMGRARALPAWFAQTHRKWRSPINAIYVFVGVGFVLTFLVGIAYGPITGYALVGTALTIAVLPIYILVAIACPIYYLRERRSEFNVLLHLLLPAVGVVFLIPAFCAGAGIPIFSFVTAFPYPLSLAGPVVGAWYLIGAGLMYYLRTRRPASLVDLTHDVADSDVVDDHVEHGALAPEHA